MAGSLSERDIIEKLPCCLKHDIPCVIKTGTKNNATHGKSFYICNNTNDRCTYAAPAELLATVCPHHEKMVELKAFAEKKDGVRCYYRCVYGKEIGIGWCDNVLLAKSKPLNILKDTTNARNQTNGVVIKKVLSSNFKSSYEQKSSTLRNPIDVHENKNTFYIPKAVQSVNRNRDVSENVDQGPEHVNDSHASNPNVFDVPKSATLASLIPDTSSTESNVSSECDYTNMVKHNDEEAFSCRKTSLSNTIEIVSSDDEDEQGDKSMQSGTIENYTSSNYFSKEKVLESKSMEELRIKIIKQEELFRRLSSKAPDLGDKLLQNINNLRIQYNQMKSHSKEPVHEKRRSIQKQSSISFPKMPAAGIINLDYNHPPSLYNNMVGQERGVPLFGGRMTETRLKEVGRITKDAIEHLHISLESCPSSTDEAEDPDGLNVKLMTHQRQALLWLLWRERQSPSGGILADDMGLGKTLTMISLTLKSKQDDLSKLKETPKDSKLQFSKATVIVCPASLVHQWHKEIEKRVNTSLLKVCLYHGSNREKRVKRLAGYDIVLTTYNIVSIEGKPFVVAEKDKPKASLSEWKDASQPKTAEEGPLFKLFWRRVILDEGHNIKNHKTAMSIAVSSLESESRWIVTGTPIQNQTMDLYSLIKFLRVSPFDELKVWKREVDNKSNSGTKRMNSIVNSILLRRTKDQIDQKTGKPIVSLPKRSSILHKVKLSTDEMCVYELVQKFSKNMFTQFLDRKDANGQPTTKDSSSDMPTEVLGMDIEEALSTFGLRGVNAANAGCLLVLVLRLRQCCGHLSLMCEPIDPELCKAEGIEVPLDEQFGNLSIDHESAMFKKKRAVQLKPTYTSTKTSAILKILKDLRSSKDSKGNAIKSVIISQWTRMLDIIAFHLKQNGFEIDFITGSVNAKKRANIVESFNTEKNPQVMLVSLKAGGVGLNLIGGSHLFLIDQHWNPALEDQACDRVYRVGQINDVVIHRFLCEDTVEERIVQLQERKKSLAHSVLYGGKTQKLTLDDLKVLFGVSR